MSFPNYGNPTDIFNWINSYADNLKKSKLIPWIRLTTSQSNGLVLQSLPDGASLTARYGIFQPNSSGAVGKDKSGKDLFADESNSYGQRFQAAPTISSLRISQNANALSNKFEFSIEANTKAQLEQLTVYFMEPGYTVLVECGWNTNDSITQKADISNICEIVKYENSQYVVDKMKKSNGTYLGFLGFITAADVSNQGTKYTLSVTVTSIGLLPSYFQPHKSMGKDEPEKEIEGYSPPFGKSEINDKNITTGQRLFRQMYNKLPSTKQISQIKDLEKERDSRGLSYADKANFINMDDELVEYITNQAAKIDDLETSYTELVYNSTQVGGGTLLPGSTAGEQYTEENISVDVSDVSFISTEAFIRLELAWKILMTSRLELTKDQNGCTAYGGSSDKDKLDYTIDIKHTVIGAHKYMFSTDFSRLWIPNMYIPDFELENSKNVEKAFLPSKVDSTYKGWDTVKKLTETEGGGYIFFPLTISYTNYTTNLKMDAFKSGHLKDLYINFDFFKSIIERDNLLIKDAVMEILNGISSAANSYWHFEIGENERGELHIIDNNYTPDLSKLKPSAYPTLIASGKGSPVLDISYKMDLPAAMSSMIIGRRLSNSLTTEAQITAINSSKLFAKANDPVLDKISNFDENPTSQSTSSTSPKKQEILQNAFNNLSGKIKFLPIYKVKDEMDGKFWEWFSKIFGGSQFTPDNLQELLKIYIPAAYYDSAYLHMVERGYFNNDGTEPGLGKLISAMPVTITISGISGLRVGDVFYLDGAPSKFDGLPFQITKIDHEIDSSGWKTIFEASPRNI